MNLLYFSTLKNYSFFCIMATPFFPLHISLPFTITSLFLTTAILPSTIESFNIIVLMSFVSRHIIIIPISFVLFFSFYFSY
eukprot:UN01198